jgi:NAD(P)-dependent dehydrogenase (short-subunit alcohol dehydrogenase family)
MTVADTGTGPGLAHQASTRPPRATRPADIASVVAFLLSQDAGWMTGQVLVVDGGVTITGVGE